MLRVAVLTLVLAAAGTAAMAGPATLNNVAVLRKLTQKSRQLVVDEASTLQLIWQHVRNADQIAKLMNAELGKSPASDLEANAKDFKSEAAAAFLECELLEAGLDIRVTDEQFRDMNKAASSQFSISRGVSAGEYHFLLGLMLNTLNQTAANESAAFKAKWGVAYTSALQASPPSERD